MLNLVRAEWLKLTRRPLTWVLLAVFLGLLLLQILAQFVIVHLAGNIGLGGDTTVFGAQLEEMRRRSAFPGLFGGVFGHINGLGGVFAVILTAGAMGSEYSWGTLRTQLARYPARGRYLIAKLVTLLALLVVAMLLALLLGSAVGGALGALVGRMGALGVRDIAVLPLAILRALYILLPYVLLTLCFTIIGRSLLVGVAGGLLYLVFEAGFGTFAAFARFGGLWRAIYNLTIQQNINTLVQLNSHTFGLRPEEVTPTLDLTQLPSPLQATLVVALYSAGFLATALYLLRKRDITGAA
jgi:ABC-type transport system involved in multi-copper enzyme maturation permease subunit